MVFDLDETLISMKQTTENANYTLNVKIKGGKIVKVECFSDFSAWSVLQTVSFGSAGEVRAAFRHAPVHEQRQGICGYDH